MYVSMYYIQYKIFFRNMKIILIDCDTINHPAQLGNYFFIIKLFFFIYRIEKKTLFSVEIYPQQ